MATSEEEKTRTDIKTKLVTLFETSPRYVNEPEIVELIDDLVKLNPTKEPACSPLYSGDWIQLNAFDYPAKKRNKSDNRFYWSLGSTSFGQFKPHDLPLSFHSVHNKVHELPVDFFDDDSKDWLKSMKIEGLSKYDLCMHWDTSIGLDKYPLTEGLLNTLGVCFPDPTIAEKNRLCVKFVGGEMYPANNDGDNISNWKNIFSEEGLKEWKMLESFFGFMMSFAFTFSEVSKIQAENKFIYNIQDKANGWHDILYLDEDIRITKGNRGTIIVVKRV